MVAGCPPTLAELAGVPESGAIENQEYQVGGRPQVGGLVRVGVLRRIEHRRLVDGLGAAWVNVSYLAGVHALTIVIGGEDARRRISNLNYRIQNTAAGHRNRHQRNPGGNGAGGHQIDLARRSKGPV